MNIIKERLRNNEATFGTWQMIGNPSVTEILCDAGYDWIAIDMEHTAIDISVALELIRVISMSGKVAAVRVSANDSTLIKRVLDCGAKAIIVPMIMNKEDAKKMVDAAYYPPKGTRGVGLFRAQRYGFGFDEYKKNQEEDIALIAQIEHIDAIENLEDICCVEGIDATMIGPYDLSGSLGNPGAFDSVRFQDAISHYEKISEKCDMPMGYHIVTPTSEDVQDHVNKGYRFIALGFDTYFLGCKSREVLQGITGE